MTRKDYVKFAEMITTLAEEYNQNGDYTSILQSVRAEMGNIFQRDNESFDRVRFYEAANVIPRII